MSAQSAEHLRKLVNERHEEVRGKLDAVINAIARNDRAQVITANSALADSLRALGAVIAREDWPAWLSDLVQHVEHLRANYDAGHAAWKGHLLTILRRFNEAQTHSWFDGDEQPLEFDLDQIIAAARAEQKIDDLFSRIVDVLQGLAKCDELDSVKACQDLEKVIAILKRAKSGSFTSQIATWQFVRRFVPNLISCYLKRSNVTGPAIEAFEETAAELDMAFDAAKDQIGEQVLGFVTGGFKSKAIQQITAGELKALPDFTDENTRKN